MQIYVDRYMTRSIFILFLTLVTIKQHKNFEDDFKRFEFLFSHKNSKNTIHYHFIACTRTFRNTINLLHNRVAFENSSGKLQKLEYNSHSSKFLSEVIERDDPLKRINQINTHAYGKRRHHTKLSET